jgi:hypothetical protein
VEQHTLELRIVATPDPANPGASLYSIQLDHLMDWGDGFNFWQLNYSSPQQDVPFDCRNLDGVVLLNAVANNGDLLAGICHQNFIPPGTYSATVSSVNGP